MATTKHKAYQASVANILTTETNSLANNANSTASSAFDNSSSLELFADFELILAAQGVARSVGAYVALFACISIDGGSQYAAANEITAKLIAAFPLDAATTARRVVVTDVPIPPGFLLFFVRNVTGQVFAASGTSLRWRPHSIEVV